MEIREGWLERSVERARKNVMERPEYLRPQKFRKKAAVAAQPKKKRATAN